MSSSPDAEDIIERWRSVIPDTVPSFDLITCSIPPLSEDSSLTEENEEDEIESFPCECQFDPSTKIPKNSIRREPRGMCLWTIKQVY
jgi:hypothetical protein